jgi:hypothetical protein
MCGAVPSLNHKRSCNGACFLVLLNDAWRSGLQCYGYVTVSVSDMPDVSRQPLCWLKTSGTTHPLTKSHVQKNDVNCAATIALLRLYGVGVGRTNSVGIATGYGLDGPGIESR